jgi:hypothetical protein
LRARPSAEELSRWHQLADSFGKTYFVTDRQEIETKFVFYKIDWVRDGWARVTRGLLYTQPTSFYLTIDDAGAFRLCNQPTIEQSCQQIKKYWNGFATTDGFGVSIAATPDGRGTMLVTTFHDPSAHVTITEHYEEVPVLDGAIREARQEAERGVQNELDNWSAQTRADMDARIKEEMSNPTILDSVRSEAAEAGRAADRSQRELNSAIRRAQGGSTPAAEESSKPSGATAKSTGTQADSSPAQWAYCRVDHRPSGRSFMSQIAQYGHAMWVPSLDHNQREFVRFVSSAYDIPTDQLRYPACYGAETREQIERRYSDSKGGASHEFNVIETDWSPEFFDY